MAVKIGISKQLEEHQVSLQKYLNGTAQQLEGTKVNISEEHVLQLLEEHYQRLQEKLKQLPNQQESNIQTTLEEENKSFIQSLVEYFASLMEKVDRAVQWTVAECEGIQRKWSNSILENSQKLNLQLQAVTEKIADKLDISEVEQEMIENIEDSEEPDAPEKPKAASENQSEQANTPPSLDSTKKGTLNILGNEGVGLVSGPSKEIAKKPTHDQEVKVTQQPNKVEAPPKQENKKEPIKETAKNSKATPVMKVKNQPPNKIVEPPKSESKKQPTEEATKNPNVAPANKVANGQPKEIMQKGKGEQVNQEVSQTDMFGEAPPENPYEQVVSEVFLPPDMAPENIQELVQEVQEDTKETMKEIHEVVDQKAKEESVVLTPEKLEEILKERENNLLQVVQKMLETSQNDSMKEVLEQEKTSSVSRIKDAYQDVKNVVKANTVGKVVETKNNIAMSLRKGVLHVNQKLYQLSVRIDEKIQEKLPQAEQEHQSLLEVYPEMKEAGFTLTVAEEPYLIRYSQEENQLMIKSKSKPEQTISYTDTITLENISETLQQHKEEATAKEMNL